MNEHKLILILPDIRSAMNVGAIFRTAEAAGVDKIYITGYTSTPNHPKVSKTALGAENMVKWEYAEDLVSLIRKLRTDNFQIVSLEKTDNSTNIWDAEIAFPAAIIVGNEIHGIAEAILGASDKIVHLPMDGSKESLNVATATGIAIYELRRRMDR